jgi:hypothetical protein
MTELTGTNIILKEKHLNEAIRQTDNCIRLFRVFKSSNIILFF